MCMSHLTRKAKGFVIGYHERLKMVINILIMMIQTPEDTYTGSKRNQELVPFLYFERANTVQRWKRG